MQGAGGQAGFCGKLPSRGDHLALGLPRGFTDPWNAWLDATLPAVRAELGEAWRDAWMEAPIWHFVLPGGQCGPGAALGVWMPSVDRVGRLFPLTLAWVGEEAAPPADDGAWREAAEAAGLAALHGDMAPEELAARLASAPSPGGETRPAGPAQWWTEGAPRVPPASLALDRLPAPDLFAEMLLAPRRETTP
jgi:type VI secretion system protein ImpM